MEPEKMIKTRENINEKVSIVLPTFNRAEHSDYLKQSVNSCLNQTHKNLELIIVDDGSTDNTQEIISFFKDKRIKKIKHKKNSGIPTALNSGFAAASGDYFTWTSDDNFFEENAIERMLSFLKEKKEDFVFSDLYEINLKKNSEGAVKYSSNPDLSKGNSIGGCFLYSKKVKETIGEYDPETILAEDFDYWIRVSKKFPLCHLPEVLYNFRVHSDSLYSSKYFEVRTVDFLLRIKHNLLNPEKTAELFAGLVAEKNSVPNFFSKIFFRKKISAIKNILKDFENKKTDFTETKDRIKKF